MTATFIKPSVFNGRTVGLVQFSLANNLFITENMTIEYIEQLLAEAGAK